MSTITDTSAAVALAEANATASTYADALEEAQDKYASLQRRLSKGDESITAAALAKASSEVDRLRLLKSSADAAVKSAKEAVQLEEADRGTAAVASILAEHLDGFAAARHLAPGERVGAVDRPEIHVQTALAPSGKYSLVEGVHTVHVHVTSAFPTLDVNLLDQFPKSLTPADAPMVGQQGVILSLKWGQKNGRQLRGGVTYYSARATIRVAEAVPELMGQPLDHRWGQLGQWVKHAVRYRSTTGMTSNIEGLDVLEAAHDTQVASDGQMTNTFTCTLPVPLDHEGDRARTVRHVKERLTGRRGYHLPALGRVTAAEVGDPITKGLMVNGVATSRKILYFPVSLTFQARISR